MKSVVKVLCEWDIGVGDAVYSSVEVAEKHALLGLEYSGIEGTLDELEAQGLISFEWIDIVFE